MKKILVLIVISLLIIAGCSHKATTKPDGQENLADKQYQKSDVSDLKKTEKIPAIPVESIDSKNNASTKATVQDNMFSDLLFDYDKYDVRDTFKPTLRSVTDFLSKYPEARISIEGHCDERGTNEYNLALGDRRAKAVKDYLVSMGVPTKKLDTISYGEERPLCKEITEECWAKNRRAHFVVLSSGAK
ncbi:MAG: peptidoglycan-associated lipoprotein Pal [Nitrospirae bacterium]|nr:peptidoglycan-associated lipoprotein Pal [Nitrospirota bacterium]